MCEKCAFLDVKDYKSALSFVKRYLILRLRNLLYLCVHGKYEEFLERYSVSNITYRDIYKRMNKLYGLVMDLEENLVSDEKFLDEVKETGLEHVLYCAHEYFPEVLRTRLQENSDQLLQQTQTIYETICNMLYLVDCSWISK